MQPTDPKRNADLENELLASPDDAACAVYADWLEQEGEPVMAAGYRLLSGVAGANAEVDRWAGIFAVSSAVWLLPWTESYDVTRTAMLEAIERGGVHTGDVQPGISDEAWRAVHRAIARLADVSRDPAALIDAVREARASVDRALFHRLFGCALRTAAATGASPMAASNTVAAAIAAISEDDLAAIELPLAGASGSIAFPNVAITNNESGIYLAWRRFEGPVSPASALVAIVADNDYEPASFNTMTPRERLDAWSEGSMTGGVDWAATSYFEMLAFLFQQQADNDGEPVEIDGKPAHVVDALEDFGVFLGGATSSGNFPIYFFELARARVFGQITY